MIAAPLDALYARRALDPDPRCNPTLFEAGQRYLRRWHGSTLCGWRAAPTLLRHPGSSPWPSRPWRPLPAIAANAVSRERLGTYLARLVDAIVTEERTPLEVGRGATRYTEKTTATAFAMEALRAGLTTLADDWGMLR